MKKAKKLNWLSPLLATILLGLFMYGMYAFYYEFSYSAEGVGGILYTIICSVALGYFTALLFASTGESKKLIKGILGFLLGNGIFHGILWGINAAINSDYLHSEDVFLKAFSVICPVTAVILLVSFILRAKSHWKAFNIILAVVYFLVCCGGGVVANKYRIKGAEFNKNITFDSISAEEMPVTESEKARCREWFNDNILLANGIKKLPFNFSVDGISLNDSLGDWLIENSPESEIGEVYKGGKTSYITFTNQTNGVVATVEATIYEESATCEWTVFVKNTGKENSDVISDFYAFNDKLDVGKADLYYSKGSDDEANDFALGMKELSTLTKTFNGTGGRSTDEFMPYFNLCGKNYGAVLGVGWTGQWESTFKKSGDDAEITVKQQNFEGYLLPGEEVRSPLVSISFYEKDNALKGFNTFRNWVKDCVYPENIPDTVTMMEVAGPASTNTADQIIDTLNSFGDDIYNNIDNFWMDAAWYVSNGDWYSTVGTWVPDPARYDNGIKELSDYAKSKGLGHVLWYEAERAANGSELYNKAMENFGWGVDNDGEYIMWNLANDEACEYLSKHIAASLIENGVTVYRQDFNFEPLPLWEKADEEYYDGRTGICENHYVTNLYKYLDYLCENVDGLIIDNCASGGRRLDLEMTRRSFPAWRSDYNCSYHYDILEATQAQTYGLSFWLPVTGTLVYSESEYSARSSIMPSVLETFGTVQSEYFAEYTEQREMMQGNYYPLTKGGYEKDEILAMQFSAEDGAKGEALVYKRSEVTDTDYTLKLNGLDPEKTYKIYDYDSPEKIQEISGEELMTNGFSIPLPEGEKAIIIMFEIA